VLRHQMSGPECCFYDRNVTQVQHINCYVWEYTGL